MRSPVNIVRGLLVFAIFLPIGVFIANNFINYEPEPLQTWCIHLIKPDGVLYKQYTVKDSRKPRMRTYDSISIVSGITAPAGWLLEIYGPIAEEEKDD